MKKFLLFAAFLITVACLGQAPDTWVQKADFATTRGESIGFSIGNKGYIGIGADGNLPYNDFWEWSQDSNIWTQKANFPGSARTAAVAFSIGTKGYIGTGQDNNNTVLNEFWEWDQATNTWTRKADFAGTPRSFAVGFSIGTKGYIGTGDDFNNTYDDFWEWDQSTNIWTQKADFAGGLRSSASGFSVGSKGYLAAGADATTYNDLWEWDQVTNSWTLKGYFGNGRAEAVGFSIGTKGYIGSGLNSSSIDLNDFWEWDQTTGIWTQKANVSGGGRRSGVGFSIGTKGYIGTGETSINGDVNDFWEYTPLLNEITTDSVSSSFYCSGAVVSVNFNIIGVADSGNVFTAQLSDASGSFASPTTIGTVASTTSGVIQVAIPANTPYGTGYRIRIVSNNPVVIGNDNGSNIAISPVPVLNLKFFIQGYYLNGGTMQPVLHNERVDTNAASTNVDTVVVELHNATSPYAVAESDTGVLQTNGTLVCYFSCAATGHSYYIAVRYRNAVWTWSAAPVAISAATNYDFTTAAIMAYGNNMIQMEPGRWAFYCGDLNQDENVDLLDFPILNYGMVYGLSGYYAADLDGDGNVDLLDFIIFNGNYVMGIYSLHP